MSSVLTGGGGANDASSTDDLATSMSRDFVLSVLKQSGIFSLGETNVVSGLLWELIHLRAMLDTYAEKHTQMIVEQQRRNTRTEQIEREWEAMKKTNVTLKKYYNKLAADYIGIEERCEMLEREHVVPPGIQSTYEYMCTLIDMSPSEREEYFTHARNLRDLGPREREEYAKKI